MFAADVDSESHNHWKTKSNQITCSRRPFIDSRQYCRTPAARQGGLGFRKQRIGELRVNVDFFTLEVDGRPTLTFEAMDISEASGISLDQDLRLDQSALSADGILIFTEAQHQNDQIVSEKRRFMRKLTQRPYRVDQYKYKV